MISKEINKNDLIIQLFVIVDDLFSRLPILSGPKVGRKPLLSTSETITCMLFGIIGGFKNIKDLYCDLKSYHSQDFTLPCYKNFVAAVNNNGRHALLILCAIIEINRKKSGGRHKFIDASCVAVCHNKRIFNHKVCAGIAERGKSTMGWFFGFKIHMIVDDEGNLLSFSVSPGNVDDRAVVRKMSKGISGTMVADAGYVGKELMYDLADMGITFLSGYKKNMKKIVTKGYLKLLKLRQIVETGFGMMKCGGNLVSSYARSLGGHLSRIIYNFLAYSVRKLSKNASFAIS